MNRMLGVLFLGCISAAAQITYRVTENPQACSEVRLPKWTRPELVGGREEPFWRVDSWSCQYDVRTGGASSLYFGLSCGSTVKWRMKQKYAVDLTRPKEVRRIDPVTWENAGVFGPSADAPVSADFRANGLRYQGQLFPKSGPKWDDCYQASLSPGRTRVAVYSYDGIITRMSEENMSALPWKWFGPMYGTYWTEIYDVSSDRRLIQIQGRFRGVDLNEVQGKSYWYGSRFFVQPLKVSGMRHLLVWDVDRAAKSSGVTEADAEVPVLRAKPYLNSSRSLYQLRWLEPEIPQAQITAFHDEPVFHPGTQTIESIRVTASVDVLD
jgi:hypothetical protein